MTHKPMFEVYLAGGVVRDILRGETAKDHDFAVFLREDLLDTMTVGEAFDHMNAWLLSEHGLESFKIKPETGTNRGRFPRTHPTWPGVAADFTLGRLEGPYSDGRHPDWVKPGTKEQDMDRRDFTINAMLAHVDDIDFKNILDLHGGMEDLETRTLRFVGNPMDRLREDAVRAMRALRFQVTIGFALDVDGWCALDNTETAELLHGISNERIADELEKMFASDTVASLELLRKVTGELEEAMFARRVRLGATLKVKPQRFIEETPDEEE